MCSQLREIYDKKSPVFLTEIGILVATIVVIQYSSACYETLHTFYLITLVISGSEIFLKSVGLAIIHAINKEIANTAQYILVGLFMILHLAVWGYSIVLLCDENFRESCKNEEPNYFYVKIYVLIYGIIIIGSLVILVLLLLPVTALTLFSFKKKDKNEDTR